MLYSWQTAAPQGRLKPKDSRLSGNRFPAAGQIKKAGDSTDNSIHLRGWAGWCGRYGCSCPPLATSIPCRSRATIAARPSSAPRLLPGRFTIKVSLFIPAIPRESHAYGLLSAPRERMASARPGASRSITRSVASGVRSRGPMPVPPTVSTSDAPAAQNGDAVGHLQRLLLVVCDEKRGATVAGPAVSSSRPCEQRSEMVKTANCILRFYSFASTLMVRSHFSASSGQVVTGSAVRLSP